MRHRPAGRLVTGLVLITALLAAGCGENSRVDPDATLHVTGTALTPAGAPLGNRPVRLGAGVPDDDATLAVLTAGLACTQGLCSGKVLDTTTNAAGAYAFTLKGKDTQGSFGRARSELVSVSAAPTGDQVSGASASARFLIQTDTVALPVLRLVDPSLSVRPQGSTVVNRWATRSPGPYALTFESGSSVPVWQATSAGSSVALDGRVLEGTSGQVVLSGGSRDAIEGSDVTLHWRSPGAAFASDTGAPASRHAACTFTRPGRTGSPAPCGLTDGDLTSTATPPSLCDAKAPAVCAPATAAVIMLAQPTRADLLVVRGCDGTCPVATSADGRAFAAAGSLSRDDATLRLGARAIRAVRIGLGTSGLREVSVWAPRVQQPALRAVAPDVLQHLRRPYAPTRHGRSHLLLSVTAGLLVLVLLLAVAFQLGRRRR